jgi:type I restriction enzyme S subunit
MSEWKEYNLNEVYDFASGLSKGASEFGFGHGFLGFKDVFHNFFAPDELTNLVNSTEKEQESCSIKRGDVFLTRTSETDEDLGMSCVALKDYPKATFNGFTKRLRPKGNVEILPEYAGFYFRSPKFRGTVSGMSSITTRASLNNSMLAQLTIDVPPVEEQKVIANTLISLYKKVHLLEKQNETLESIAETLFKKIIENKTTPSELGTLATISSGKGLKRNEFKENGVFPVVGANGEIGRTDKYFIDEKVILTGRVGTLGKINIYEEKIWISDNVLIIKPNSQKHFYPIYFSLKKVDFESLNVGSTQPLLTQTDLKKVDLELPHSKYLDEFVSQSDSLFLKRSANQRQIKILKKQLNNLLPKLMTREAYISI